LLVQAESAPKEPKGHTTAHQVPEADLSIRLEQQDRRIEDLERALTQDRRIEDLERVLKRDRTRDDRTCSQHDQRTLPSPAIMPVATQHPVTIEPNNRDAPLLKGKSFKTQFYGSTHPGSLLGHIPELSSFTKEAFERNPIVCKTRQGLKRREPRRNNLSSITASDAGLNVMLPSRAETEDMVRLYLDNYDAVYHVLHGPSFHREYSNMWNALPNADPRFVALVLLIVASTRCLASPRVWHYFGNSSEAREKAMRAIEAVESWLHTQSQKHVTVVDFQIRFLLMFAKYVTALKLKRSWTEAGTFLRFCMAAGLHRDPSLLRKATPVLDKEMRRRIWAAAVEFELQAAFQRGTLASSWPEQSDSPPPSNIDDVELDQNLSRPVLPARPLQEFTKTSYLTAAQSSFMLRYAINNILNSVRQGLGYEDTRRYTEELDAQIRAVPQWTEPESEIPRMLLSLTLHQYALAMHNWQYRHISSTSVRNYTKFQIIEHSKCIIDIHKAQLAKGSRALQCLVHDHMRPALSLLLLLANPDPQTDSVLLHDLVQQVAESTVRDTMTLLTDRVVRYGSEQRQLWTIATALAAVKSKLNPAEKSAYMQEAVDAVMKPWLGIMMGQGQANIHHLNSPSPPRLELPMEADERDAVRGGDESEDAGRGPADFFGFDDMSTWTFDDWTFDGADLDALCDPFPATNP